MILVYNDSLKYKLSVPGRTYVETPWGMLVRMIGMISPYLPLMWAATTHNLCKWWSSFTIITRNTNLPVSVSSLTRSARRRQRNSPSRRNSSSRWDPLLVCMDTYLGCMVVVHTCDCDIVSVTCCNKKLILFGQFNVNRSFFTFSPNYVTLHTVSSTDPRAQSEAIAAQGRAKIVPWMQQLPALLAVALGRGWACLHSPCMATATSTDTHTSAVRQIRDEHSHW